MPKKDTSLEAEGAEFLVLGNLLVEGLQAHKMYTNTRGYDVLVVNPEANPNRVARVQVKSRWKKSARGIIIKNFDSDFVVVAKLNKGTGELEPPQFYVIPTEAVRNLPRDGRGKLNFSAIPNFDGYLSAWPLIRDFLGLASLIEPIENDSTESEPTPCT